MAPMQRSRRLLQKHKLHFAAMFFQCLLGMLRYKPYGSYCSLANPTMIYFSSVDVAHLLWPQWKPNNTGPLIWHLAFVSSGLGPGSVVIPTTVHLFLSSNAKVQLGSCLVSQHGRPLGKLSAMQCNCGPVECSCLSYSDLRIAGELIQSFSCTTYVYDASCAVNAGPFLRW